MKKQIDEVIARRININHLKENLGKYHTGKHPIIVVHEKATALSKLFVLFCIKLINECALFLVALAIG